MKNVYAVLGGVRDSNGAGYTSTVKDLTTTNFKYCSQTLTWFLVIGS